MANVLYSYVVDHDHGRSPNPESGFCTLVHCMHKKKGGKDNIVEKAQVGDWIMGTGGLSKDSAGHGKIIYLMRVDEKIPFKDFLVDPRFNGRWDQRDNHHGNQWALVSSHFHSFGQDALSIAQLPQPLRTLQLEKRGPRYRRDLPEDKVLALTQWMAENQPFGKSGEPCAPLSDHKHCVPTCVTPDCDDTCQATPPTSVAKSGSSC